MSSLRLTGDDRGADWTEQGVFTVAPGVHRIPLPLPGDVLRAVNVYAIEDGDALVLVDSGQVLDAALELVEEALATLGRGLGDVRRFLITHVHRDHYTLAVALRRKFGSRISLGIGEQPSLRIAAGSDRPGAAQLELLSRAGAGPVIELLGLMDGRDALPRDIWEDPDDWLAPEVEVPVGARRLHAVATPGHTRGHVVFHDAGGGLLFAGDHVLPHITPSIGFEPAVAPLPLRDYLNSLRLVREMPDAVLLPAHGPVSGSVHHRVDELLAHHEARLAAIAEQVDAGRHTAYSVAGGLTWTRRGRHLVELDAVNQMLAVIETKSHLDVLVMQGRLSCGDVDGVAHYAAR